MKKNIPLRILKAIEPTYKEYKQYVSHISETSTYYTFLDKDPESSFYFKVYKQPTQAYPNGSPYNIYYQFKPRSAESLVHLDMSTDNGNVLQTEFKAWLEIIKSYNDFESIYDDPFIKSYQEYYFSQFKIIDEDADTHPFSIPQQDLLNKYLNTLEKNLLEEKNDDNQAIITALVEEKIRIEEDLNVSTKNEFLKKLSTLFGRIYKWNKDKGAKYFKIFLKEIVKELIKEGVKQII